MSSASGTVQGTPAPIYACQEPLCLHKWTRKSEEACEHTIQRLIDLSVGDTGQVGRYVCEACGAELVRPYEAYQ